MGLALHLDDVCMTLGGRLVLDRFALRVAEGESVALLGASGSGKTTALRVAAGFLQPDRGRVWVGEQDVTPRPPEMRHMAMIHQRFLLFPHLKVTDNIAFGLRYQGLPSSEHRQRVASLLALVGLEGLEQRYPHQLSGGQQQRVAIARALAVQPRVLLLDEPLNNLDSAIGEHLLDELRLLQRSTGMAMLYVTHNQAEAAHIAHRVALLEGGGILQQGTFEELLERPASVRAAVVLGLKNLYPVRRAGERLEIPALGVNLPLDGRGAANLLAYLPVDRVRLRPTDQGWGRFEGRVEEIITGALATRLCLHREGIRLTAAVRREELAGLGVALGCVMTLHFDTAALQLLPGGERREGEQGVSSPC